MPTGRSKQETTRRDANDARKNRRKAGKRRRGKAVAAHCTRCNQRPAEPGQTMCLRCYRLPFCAGLDCRQRVDQAGALCEACSRAVFG